MSDPKPPLTADIVWSERQQFGVTTGSNAFVLDGDGVMGPSPMELMASSVAGCMAIDVVLILQKGRHPLQALRASFSGERAADPPRRFTSIDIHFQLTGNVPDEAVERAIDLSREKYCSAWNSMRQDIQFTTRFTITRE
ncbi:MAG: OsmC family protein [Vicinamibacterales bacterium]